MSHADHLVLGQNNVLCDICGWKFKSNELKKTWDGYWACKRDWYPRHPQDFVKGVTDTQKTILDRPEATDVYTAEAQALTIWSDPASS